MTVPNRPWGVSWKGGSAKSEVKQISCICVFCGRCYSEGISYGKPDIGLKRDCSLSGGSYEATWERQIQWITAAYGINLRSLKEINCEIAEIVMRSFHVLWLLLGASKSLDKIDLIFLPNQKRLYFRIYCLDGVPYGFWTGRFTRVQDVRKANSVSLD